MTVNDAVVATVFGLGVVSALLQWINGKKAAAKVEEVKETLAFTNSAIDGKLDTIHILVNSKLGRVLRTNAATLRALAILTRDPSVANLADEAESESADHEARQAVVDARTEDKQ